MARVILHIGTHKTGSTSLQRSLYAQREKLKLNNICYDPWPGTLWGLKYAHHGLAHRLARYDSDDRKILSEYRCRIDKAISQGSDVIISAEPFYRQIAIGMEKEPAMGRIEFLDRAADYFSGLSTQVSVCFRRPDLMAESLFKEHAVKTSNKLDFASWLKVVSPRFDYAARLGEFEQRFGEVKVWFFEDAVRSGLVSTFMKMHDIEIPDLLEAEADRKSISCAATLWLLKAKREAGSMSSSEMNKRWYYAGSGHAHQALAQNGNASFWPDAKTRDAFLDRALANFRYAGLWDRPSKKPQQVEWTDGDQTDVEEHYNLWLQDSFILLKMRRQAKLAPYQGDDAIPLLLKLKYMPLQLYAWCVSCRRRRI